MMGMIGFTVGFIGFLLHNLIDAIEEPILDKALGYVQQKYGEICTSDSIRLLQIRSNSLPKEGCNFNRVNPGLK